MPLRSDAAKNGEVKVELSVEPATAIEAIPPTVTITIRNNFPVVSTTFSGDSSVYKFF